MNLDQIQQNFTYHAPTEDEILTMQQLRAQAKILAIFIDSVVPDSREKSLALTNLEQAVMWSNAGIVRNREVNE